MTNPDLLQQALDALIYHTNQTRPIHQTDEAIERLRAELMKNNASPADGWMPMETAPRFSDEIDIWASGMRFTYCAYGKPTYGKDLGWIYESHHDSDGPVYEIVKNPTHWMPIPKAPS